MPWSYDLALSTVKDQVRLHIGDTNSATPLLSDEEIDYFVRTESNVFAAASAAAYSLASRYARLGSRSTKKMGDLSITTGDLSGHFTALAESLYTRSRSSRAIPSAGGVEAHERDQSQNDDTLVHSGIRTSIHDFVIPPRRPNVQ